MKQIQQEGLIFWQFDLLLNCPEIIHGSFTRHGGYSIGDFSSLNASLQVNDNQQHVMANRAKIQQTLGLSSLVFANQIHGNTALKVTSLENLIVCDALITTRKAIGLSITHADCQAALLYDPIKQVIANVHAGWRGMVKGIYTSTVNKLRMEYNSKPQNLLVCISPSLGPESAEFVNYPAEFPSQFWSHQIKPTYFDLWSLAQAELEQIGVLPSHIEIAKIDTYANPCDYFSYRQHKSSGRLATVIGLI